MLFGEYAILAGGEALAIPYPQYHLTWTQNKPAGTETKTHLQNYLSWLIANNFAQSLNLDQFKNDLENGLDVESNIPIGYGLGSSGAIVAAVYDRYILNKIDEHDLPGLKLFLGKMENYFHQKSSGLDPLVSYLQAGIHLADNKCRLIKENIITNSGIEVSLIDTGKSRHTSELVLRFNELMGLEHYKHQFENEYLPLLKNCIRSYLENQKNQLDELLYKLSSLQLTLFSFAIPTDIYQDWIIGLANKTYYKLCGAGGGGFMLRFKV